MPCQISETIGHISEFVALASLIGHFIQFLMHKRREAVVLGYLHGLKPVIESAAAGSPTSVHTWAGQVKQIDDMMARLQPPKKH